RRRRPDVSVPRMAPGAAERERQEQEQEDEQHDGILPRTRRGADVRAAPSSGRANGVGRARDEGRASGRGGSVVQRDGFVREAAAWGGRPPRDAARRDATAPFDAGKLERLLARTVRKRRGASAGVGFVPRGMASADVTTGGASGGTRAP